MHSYAALITIAKTWKQPKCPWTDEGVNKMWLHIYNGIRVSHKNETTPMERLKAHGETERSKSERERQTPYDITYKFTNELIYKIETDSQIERTDWLPRGSGGGGGMQWEFGISRYKLVYVGWIHNQVLLYSTGSCIQYLVINHNGKEYENECIHAYN